VFVIGAAGDTIAEKFVGDVAAGIHAADAVVGTGGSALVILYR
jgi:hypothetical protein